MTDLTLTDVTIFDQHDLELIAARQLTGILARADEKDMNVMLRVGRKIVNNQPLEQRDTLQLYMVMMGLRLDGIVCLPPTLLNHTSGRQQTYRWICRKLFEAVR